MHGPGGILCLSLVFSDRLRAQIRQGSALRQTNLGTLGNGMGDHGEVNRATLRSRSEPGSGRELQGPGSVMDGTSVTEKSKSDSVLDLFFFPLIFDLCGLCLVMLAQRLL